MNSERKNIQQDVGEHVLLDKESHIQRLYATAIRSAASMNSGSGLNTNSG